MLTPRSASFRAMPRPIPRELPVTSACFPWSDMSISFRNVFLGTRPTLGLARIRQTCIAPRSMHVPQSSALGYPVRRGGSLASRGGSLSCLLLCARSGYHFEKRAVGAGRRHLADHRRLRIAGGAERCQGGLRAHSGHAEEEAAGGLGIED